MIMEIAAVVTHRKVETGNQYRRVVVALLHHRQMMAQNCLFKKAAR